MYSDNEEFWEKCDEYCERFGDVFPTIPSLGTDEECIEIINRCLAENKTIEELGYITYDLDTYY